MTIMAGTRVLAARAMLRMPPRITTAVVAAVRTPVQRVGTSNPARMASAMEWDCVILPPTVRVKTAKKAYRELRTG